MAFSVRTSKPGSGNKNFIRTATGGWNTCIKGSPTDSQCDVLANCVGYASGRFNEIINQVRGTSVCTYKTLNCNAENFVERALAAGLKIGSTPKVGAIMVWQKGTLASSDGAGHVAIVEKVNSNSSVYTSESGYGSTAFWNQTRSNSNGKWGLSSSYTFRCFIYLPDDVQNGIGGSTTPSAPATPSKSIDEVAKDVIAGKYGNQPDRQKKLEAEGYNYTEVQNKVNAILNENKSTSTSQPAPVTYNVGDTVYVNGSLTADSYGGGAQTKSYNNQAAKIIMIKDDGRARPFALNMNNNMNGVTGWGSKDQIRK